MSSSDREGNDLTAIKGIGPARQRWFRESLNICTFRDLAALSADEIESRLKAEGQIASRGEIDGWIAQAQELAAAVNLSSQRAVEAAEGEWQPFASFVVEFQARRIKGLAEERRTMVHHMEADKGETWSGIEGERLCHWMLDQVGARVQQVIEEKLPAEVRPAFACPVTVEIAQVRAFQPPQTETPIGVGEAGRPFRGFVRGGEPFALEASFGLAGPAAAEIAKKQITYHAQFHARSLPTGERIHLGDIKPNTLVEGKLSYTAVLPEATLRPGLYRLRVLATLQGMPPILGYLEVPLLQVV
jgi:hypothetical protein